MEIISGKERVRAAAKRTFADRVPVGIIMGHFTTHLTRCPLQEFYHDAKKLADCLIAGYERFHQDTVGVGVDPHKEVEAMGAPLDWATSYEPTIARRLLEDPKKLSSLKLPDPRADGRLPMYLEACRRVLTALPEAAVGGTVNGPWNMACALRGVERLILDCMDDPRFVRDLMAFTVEISKAVGWAIAETGVSLSLAEATASCSLISPTIYRQHIFPYHQALVDYFRERKKGLSVHICGYIDPIMKDLVEAGFTGISLDSLSSLRQMVTLANRKTVVVGNVATHLFIQGSKEDIDMAVRDCIDTAASGSAYILSTGCTLPYASDVERVDYYMECARKYGDYGKLRSAG